MSSDSGSSTSDLPIVGLIALDRDTVIEADMHHLVGDRASVVTTRIPLGEIGSMSHLLELESHVPEAVGRLAGAAPGVVAFGCTSGIALGGRDALAESIHRALPGIAMVDPLTAMAYELRRLGAVRLALLTPYHSQILRSLVRWIEEEGFVVAEDIRIEVDAVRYGDIAISDIVSAATRSRFEADALVVACTALRAVEAIDEIRKAVNVPVVSSNGALAAASIAALVAPHTAESD